MTKPNDTKSSLFAGGQLLPETSPEEYQKAAREDVGVAFDDARIAELRTQAVARAEAGLADWERRIPSSISKTGTWRVTVGGQSADFIACSGYSRKQIVATARMAWEREHRLKLQEDVELDVREVVTEVAAPFTGTTSSSIGRSDPSRTEAARVDGNVIQFDPTIGVKFRQTVAPWTAPMVGSRWRLTEHTSASVPAGPWTVSSVEWRNDEEWVTMKFHAADPMERLTSRETLANFRGKFALWDEPAIARIAALDWASPQQTLGDTRKPVDEAAAEWEQAIRKFICGAQADEADFKEAGNEFGVVLREYYAGRREDHREVLRAVVSRTIKEMTATRDVKAGEMVTAKDVKRDEPPRRPYRFEYDVVCPSDGVWPDSLEKLRESFGNGAGPVHPGSLADLQSQPGVRSARNDGPGRVVVMLKRDASDSDVRGLRTWAEEHLGFGGVMMLEREPPTLEAYVKEQMADVPAGWLPQNWAAQVLGLLERYRHAFREPKRDAERPDRVLAWLQPEVDKARAGKVAPDVLGLATTPAAPRWWLGEKAPERMRMGKKRGTR